MENTIEVNEILAEKRSDLISIDPRVINVVDGFNIREDYGDIEELAKSIEENGVRVPLRGYKKDGTYYLTDGHRRHKATMLLAERGVNLRVPFISEKSPSEEKRIIDMYICNDGKRLTPLEEAALMQRLVSLGYSVKDIHSKLKKTETHIYNMLKLADMPIRLKNRIKNNDISATLVIQVLRNSNKSMTADDIAKEIESTLDNNATTGKKVTRKVLDKAMNKVNSFADLKKVMADFPEHDNRHTKLYEFAVNLVQNKLSSDDIIELLGIKK